MADETCKYSPDQFCYICGGYIKQRSEGQSLAGFSTIHRAYKAYFGLDIENQDKPWVPHFACSTCSIKLREWYNGKNRSLNFVFPRLWFQLTDHTTDDCYFCKVDISTHHEHTLLDNDIKSSKAPIPRKSEHIVPCPPGQSDKALSQSERCKYSPDQFCYICGTFLDNIEKCSIASSEVTCKAYQKYFKIKVLNQDKEWTPHFFCKKCCRELTGWYRGEPRQPSVSSPKLWYQTVHNESCFFCWSASGGGGADPSDEFNVGASTSTAPVQDEFNVGAFTSTAPVQIPVPSVESEIFSSTTQSSSVNTLGTIDPEDRSPHMISQQELNDLIRDLGLTKDKGELLTSRLKEWNLVDKSVKVSEQRTRQKPFSVFFETNNNLVHCNDVNGLFAALNIVHDPKEWRLFIDGSTQSLKAVLLHNGNVRRSIPLAYSATLKENYDNIKHIMDSIQYNEHQWEVVSDFKMITFLSGLQGGWTKYSCFLCLWDSRDTRNHYHKQFWPERKEYTINKQNIAYEPLVDKAKILLPPLHIKLGLAKQFIKNLDKDSDAYKHVKQTFPNLSEAKVKEGVLVGPQITKLINDQQFKQLLSREERVAWDSFCLVTKNFLGNNRADNYVDLVTQMLNHYNSIGCRMSLKLHILHAHLNCFKENNGAFSDEQGERFHQDIKPFEKRYKGKSYEEMLADYMWNLQRDTEDEHHRNVRRKY